MAAGTLNYNPLLSASGLTTPNVDEYGALMLRPEEQVTIPSLAQSFGLGGSDIAGTYNNKPYTYTKPAVYESQLYDAGLSGAQIAEKYGKAMDAGKTIQNALGGNEYQIWSGSNGNYSFDPITYEKHWAGPFGKTGQDILKYTDLALLAAATAYVGGGLAGLYSAPGTAAGETAVAGAGTTAAGGGTVGASEGLAPLSSFTLGGAQTPSPYTGAWLAGGTGAGAGGSSYAPFVASPAFAPAAAETATELAPLSSYALGAEGAGAATAGGAPLLTEGAAPSLLGGGSIMLPEIDALIAASQGASAAATPWYTSALNMLPGTGITKAALPMMALGTVSNYLSSQQKKKQEEEYGANLKSSLSDYLSTATWNDTTRANMMKGVEGELAAQLAGYQRRLGSSAAESGRGGGAFYGNKLEKARQANRETLAKTLAATYEPSTVSPGVYEALAKANTSSLPASSSVLEGVSELSSKWPYLLLASKLFGGGGN